MKNIIVRFVISVKTVLSRKTAKKTTNTLPKKHDKISRKVCLLSFEICFATESEKNSNKKFCNSASSI